MTEFYWCLGLWATFCIGFLLGGLYCTHKLMKQVERQDQLRENRDYSMEAYYANLRDGNVRPVDITNCPIRNL